MTRILAISDIHGMYDEFTAMLDQVQYNPDQDQLILLGDYVDRGLKSKEVVEFIMHLVQEYGVIALKGNHDDMFVKHILSDSDEDSYRHMKNGGLTTFQSYYGSDCDVNTLTKAKQFILDHYPHHITFLKNLPLYYETDRYIFVHAGINPECEDWKLTSERDMIWIRDTFYNRELRTDKIVIFGHTTCLTLHGHVDIWFGGNKIGIDGGCAYGYQLNCLEICEDEYKTHAVHNKSTNQPSPA